MMRMPAEFGRHERTVMCWPTRIEIYGERMSQARRAHASVAKTVSGFEPVTMIANPSDVEVAAQMCGGSVEIVALPIDDSWFRDTGPIYVTDGKHREGTCWKFNSWGEKYLPYDNDAKIAAMWLQSRGETARNINMVLEGGSITTNGEGVLVTTEQCLLHKNRNPHLSRDEIAARVCAELGQDRIVWLPHGLFLDDGTDGHVDNVAAFASTEVIVMQGCDDKNELDHARMATNHRDAADAGLQVREITVLPFAEIDGRRVVVPYGNFYVVNGGVIVPVCGHAADDDVLALIGEWFPGREIVGLDVGEILAYGGGGIHCITQQVPAV
ncbi:MAG: agmatine deiminase family protein [Ilumatobacteraceae bacterium]